MRFLLILASGGVGRIFFTRRGQIAAPGLDSVLLAAPGGSWAGFYALWRLLGWDSGFLAASGLNSVLVAASGLDSGFLGGFWARFWAPGGVLVSRNGVVFSPRLERESGFMILHSIAQHRVIVGIFGLLAAAGFGVPGGSWG